MYSVDREDLQWIWERILHPVANDALGIDLQTLFDSTTTLGHGVGKSLRPYLIAALGSNAASDSVKTRFARNERAATPGNTYKEMIASVGRVVTAGGGLVELPANGLL